MANPKKEYGKGYVDGLHRAEFEKNANVIDILFDALTGPAHYNSRGSEVYKAGWRDGKKDGWGKKR
ncbi:TPA: hypothetical protein EYP66_20530 [Candidatus Poribacteria bacterium]|nr:hypothetical protein [Candidatus Poribacteria bacterium]